MKDKTFHLDEETHTVLKLKAVGEGKTLKQKIKEIFEESIKNGNKKNEL